MENRIVTINNTKVPVKEYRDKRVVTLKEIDAVHQRPEGTAGRNFATNKEHFIEGVDFFQLKYEEARSTDFVERPNSQGLTLVTESGYLMLVKSFTDDLAWEVQRQLVSTYFRARDAAADLSELSPTLRVLIGLELMQKEQSRAIDAVNQRLDGIRDVVALNPVQWREESQSIIANISRELGGVEHIRDVHAEIYALVDTRAGCCLKRRLENLKARSTMEGRAKSKVNALNKLDVIGQDKKLIEIYIAIVKEMAVKYGVTTNKEEI